ncbi:MAG: septal ring lytic transglycosylase RlpA family protein [Desulfobacterales bacterium]|nr:septal ring lytic transglycosylase RlpA family protein [Desulfobacterales bacterium]
MELAVSTILPAKELMVMYGIRRLRIRLSSLGFILVCASFVFWCFGCASEPQTSQPPPPSKPGQPKPYKVLGKWYQPLPHSEGFRQRGLASWYGREFHGKKTSNGEIYNMYAMTAAHKTLPLGTYVRVLNLENNRSVEVRINDRGPFVRGRIIDLSYTAAKQIGIVGPGTARVEVVALGKRTTTSGTSASTYKAGDYSTGNFTFQVGAFVSRENAEKQRRQLALRYKNAHIVTYDRGDQVFYRVRVGRFTTLEEAIEQEKILIQDGFVDPILVAE